MIKFRDVVQDRNGNVLQGASVRVFNVGTETLSTIYSDDGITSADNPLTTDANGVFEFYVESGDYTLSASIAGVTVSVEDISIADLAIGSVSQSSLSASSGSSLVGFIQSGTGATARTMQAKGRDIVSVKDFGAVGDGVTDDLAAFQSAAAEHKVVYVPVGVYNVSGTTTISKEGARWFGDGISASIISSSSTNTPIFSINNGLNGVTIESMQLTRSVTATSGGHGIQSATVSIGQAMLRRLLVQKQFIGMNLGPTDWSEIEKCIVAKNLNDGIVLNNTATDGAVQWSMDTVLSQMNAGRGFLFASSAGPAGCTVGTFKNCASFANTGFGLAIVGSSGVPINGVRIAGGFYGEDANSAIYLDTYGAQHMITGVFTELAGRRTTGPTLATAASNIGSGIEVTSNNTNIQITGCHADSNSLDGFYLNGTTHSVSGCRATNNGLALTVGRRNGINSGSGRVVVSGGTFGNTGAGASQQYGAFIADGNNIAIMGADLTNNATAAWGATANATYVTSIANLPNTLGVGLSPAGAVLVGGGATGDFNAAGTINVAGGLLKNDTAYTNP